MAHCWAPGAVHGLADHQVAGSLQPLPSVYSGWSELPHITEGRGLPLRGLHCTSWQFSWLEMLSLAELKAVQLYSTWACDHLSLVLRVCVD